MFGKLAPAGTLVAFIISSAASLMFLPSQVPHHLLASLAVALIPSAWVWWWLFHADLFRETQTPNQAQRQAKVHDSSVSEGSVNRIRHLLLEGEEIHDIRHHSVLWLLSRIWISLASFVGLLVVTVMIAAHFNPVSDLKSPFSSGSPHQQTTSTQSQPSGHTIPSVKPAFVKPGTVHLPTSLSLPWWIFALLAVLPLYVAYRRWLDWISWFVVYTGERFLVVVEPFFIFPFYKSTMEDEFPVSRIEKVEVMGSDFEKRWGLKGSQLSIATLLSGEEEASLHNDFQSTRSAKVPGIVGLLRPDEIKDKINVDIRNRKRALQQETSTSSWATAEQTERLIAVHDRAAAATTELTEEMRLARQSAEGNPPDEG